MSIGELLRKPQQIFIQAMMSRKTCAKLFAKNVYEETFAFLEIDHDDFPGFIRKVNESLGEFDLHLKTGYDPIDGTPMFCLVIYGS
jgi:hypothetical protein